MGYKYSAIFDGFECGEGRVSGILSLIADIPSHSNKPAGNLR
jgi:hypothetical protein